MTGRVARLLGDALLKCSVCRIASSLASFIPIVTFSFLSSCTPPFSANANSSLKIRVSYTLYHTNHAPQKFPKVQYLLFLPDCKAILAICKISVKDLNVVKAFFSRRQICSTMNKAESTVYAYYFMGLTSRFAVEKLPRLYSYCQT